MGISMSEGRLASPGKDREAFQFFLRFSGSRQHIEQIHCEQNPMPVPLSSAKVKLSVPVSRNPRPEAHEGGSRDRGVRQCEGRVQL